MRVVGYIRVSTAGQADDGLGLEVQEDSLETWARTHKHELTDVYCDAGQSGSNGLESRIGLADALAAIRSGEAGGLVVYRLDRLARDLVLQEQLLAEVWRMGGAVFSASPSESAYLEDTPDDPSRALIRQVLGAVAQYERAMIGLRLRSGRERKAARGGYAFGSPPFGWTAVDGELVKDPTEQATIYRARQLRKAGLTLRAVCDALSAEGREAKRGGQFSPASLSRILERSK